MLEAVRASLLHPMTHELARAMMEQATADLPAGADPTRETMETYARLAHAWGRTVQWYRETPEVVATVPRLVECPVGDCDDTAAALAALMIAVGLTPMIESAERGSTRHVWCSVPALGLHLDTQIPWDDCAGADPSSALTEQGFG